MVFLPGHCPMDYRKVMEYAVPPLTPTDAGGRVALRYCNKDHTALQAAPGLLWTLGSLADQELQDHVSVSVRKIHAGPVNMTVLLT